MKQSGIIFTAHKPISIKWLLFSLVTTLSLLFVAFNQFTTSPPKKASAAALYSTITIRNMIDMPAQLTIPAGTTVTWMNAETNIPHTSTSDNGLWDSGVMQPGQTFSYTFMNPGVYAYHCRIHPFMHGVVVVTGASYQTPQSMQINPYYNSTGQAYYLRNTYPPMMQYYYPTPTPSAGSAQSQYSMPGNTSSAQCTNMQTNTMGSTSNNCNININQQSQTQMRPY